MRRRLSIWLLASLGIHAGLVALVLALVGLAARPLPALFVDLVQEFLGVSDPGAAGMAGRRAGTPAAPLPARPREPRPARPVPEPPRTAPEWLRVEREQAPAEPVQPAPVTAAPVTPSGAFEIALPSAPPGGRVDVTPRVSESGGPSMLPAPGGPGASAGGRGGGATRSGGRGLAGDGVGLGLGAREGSVLALAIPGGDGGAGSEYDGYVALLRRRVQETLAYPPAARRRELTGTVHVEVEVQPTGAITRVGLAVSSSHRVLDEAALEAVRGVERVPFPSDVRPRALRVRLPVVFDLR